VRRALWARRRSNEASRADSRSARFKLASVHSQHIAALAVMLAYVLISEFARRRKSRFEQVELLRKGRAKLEGKK